MVIFAERALEADPKDFRAMLMLANHYATHTRENDLDREEKLGKAEKYANQVIEHDEDGAEAESADSGRAVGGRQEGHTAEAYNAIGVANLTRKKYDAAAAAFKSAVDANSRPEPAYMVRLASALQSGGKNDEAIVWCDKVTGHARGAPADQDSGYADSRGSGEGRRQGARRRGQVICPSMRAEPALLELKLKYRFTNQELLRRALTHSSLACETRNGARRRLIDNEQLEFLGDAVLGLVVSDVLFRRFPWSKEGELSHAEGAPGERRAPAWRGAAAGTGQPPGTGPRRGNERRTRQEDAAGGCAGSDHRGDLSGWRAWSRHPTSSWST